MQSSSLAPMAKGLVSHLEAATQTVKPESQHVYHVVGIGSGFYFAYEQLRNVAEYRERHLLLRSAIERFLTRHLRLRKFQPIAVDLVTELTQTGYLKNDSIQQAVGAEIDALLAKYAEMFEALRSRKSIGAEKAADWVIQTASVQIENLLAPDPRNGLVMQFAFEHYYQAVDPGVAKAGLGNDQQYLIALYCAVQRAIFKSDLATTRYYCLAASLPNPQTQRPDHFAELNQRVDEFYQAPVTNRLFRLVTRYGAPMRILREFVMAGNFDRATLSNRTEVLSRIRALCNQRYAETHKRLNSRILRSIAFIFVTKIIVGVALEVPYDLAIRSAIAWMPLGINVLFPVVYMATIGLRIQTPSRHNTEVIAGYIDRILYEGAGPEVTYTAKRRVKSRSLNGVFTAVYAIGFAGSIALVVWLLHLLDFNLVNGGIFFLFFSAVSFLGFRLRQSAHELQVVDERQGLVQTLLDFLSTPFIRVGHWLSDKYARANIVVLVLDTAIEMPLKTSLRLVQQWVGFLRDKQEEL